LIVGPILDGCNVAENGERIRDLVAHELHRILDAAGTSRPAAHGLLDAIDELGLETRGLADVGLLAEVLRHKMARPEARRRFVVAERHIDELRLLKSGQRTAGLRSPHLDPLHHLTGVVCRQQSVENRTVGDLSGELRHLRSGRPDIELDVLRLPLRMVPEIEADLAQLHEFAFVAELVEVKQPA
jgi:hypothetical protein